MPSNREQAAGVKRARSEHSGKTLLHGADDIGKSDSTGVVLQEGATARMSQGSRDVYHEALPSIEVWVNLIGETRKLVGLQSDGCTKIRGALEVRV